MASAALQAFRQVVTVAWPKRMDAEAKTFLLKTARDGHAGIMARQGHPAFEVYANRPGNSNIDSVVLPGPIVYTYSNVRELVDFALDELRKASPVEEGDYARAHTIFVNGVPVATLPQDIKPSDEIMLANPVPYARRLEIGKTKSGRSFVLQVPDRIYERVAKRKLIPRYRNVASIAFGYRELPEAYVTRAGLASHYGTKEFSRNTNARVMRKRRQKAGSKVQSPVIIIKALGS